MDNELKTENMEPDFSWGKEDRVFPKPNDLEPDFSWTEDKGYDIELNARNPHDCKDELAKQWWKGDILHTPENNATERMKTAKTAIIKMARDLMNGGASENLIRERLAQTVKPETLQLFGNEIENQLRLCGSVGRFILDARGYKNCKEALSAAKYNPYRKYIAYVIGCKCGVPKRFVKQAKQGFNFQAKDMVLGEDGTPSEVYEGCGHTGMKIMAGQGDIDASWAGDTMIDIINATNKDSEKVKSFVASKEIPYLRLKRFFIALDQGLLERDNKLQEVTPVEDYTVNAQKIDVVPTMDKNLDVEMGGNGDSFGFYKEDETLPITGLDIEDMPSNYNFDLCKTDSSINLAPETVPIEIEIPTLNQNEIVVEEPISSVGEFSLNDDKPEYSGIIIDIKNDGEDICLESPEILDVRF